MDLVAKVLLIAMLSMMGMYAIICIVFTYSINKITKSITVDKSSSKRKE